MRKSEGTPDVVYWVTDEAAFRIESNMAIFRVRSGKKVIEFRCPAATFPDALHAAAAIYAEHIRARANTIAPACQLCDRRPIRVEQPA